MRGPGIEPGSIGIFKRVMEANYSASKLSTHMLKSRILFNKVYSSKNYILSISNLSYLHLQEGLQLVHLLHLEQHSEPHFLHFDFILLPLFCELYN